LSDEYTWEDQEVTPGHLWIDPVVMRLLDEIRPTRVLDLGCGNGVLTAKIKRAGFDVVGVDPSKSGIDEARKMHPGIEFKVCGVYDDPAEFDLSGFDLVVSEEVIEHLYYPDKLLEFSFKVLAQGGQVIITTPYYGYLRNLALAVFNRWDHHLTPLWNHGHIKLFSHNSMSKLLERNSFRMLHMTGAGNFRYFWKSMVVIAAPKQETI
jgi:2-polyprenyl-3-methyl-5-hydroxy-6-metoxy-1,4-benzoquinol methylase